MSVPDPNKYLILIEHAESNYSAWSPDLLGCVSTGATIPETIANMREAIAGHLQVMSEYGDTIPEPSGPGIYIEASDAAVQAAA
jgi:predicted RNase H-like HicB family nuclease